MKVEISRADTSDLSVLIAWRMEVLHAVFGLEEGAKAEQLKKQNTDYYKKSLSDGSHIAVFARLDGQIVGCGGLCIYQEMPSPDNLSGVCGYLMNIYTRSEYRRNGIGKAVVEQLIVLAKEVGAGKIYLETSDDGRNLYRSMGFDGMTGYMCLKK